jgi:hypothetical protein
MPKPATTSFARAYAAVGGDLTKRLGDAQAALAGPPIGDKVEPAGDTERAEAWNARHPEATDEAMVHLAVERYQSHRAAGMDEARATRATAEDLTHFRYRNRVKIYTYGMVDFSDQVKEAQRIAKLAQRESTPNPLPPQPDQRTAALTNAQMQGVELPAEVPPAPELPLEAPGAALGLEMPPGPTVAPAPRSEPPAPHAPPTGGLSYGH